MTKKKRKTVADYQRDIVRSYERSTELKPKGD